jgi:FkbM family methyltransferase
MSAVGSLALIVLVAVVCVAVHLWFRVDDTLARTVVDPPEEVEVGGCKYEIGSLYIAAERALYAKRAFEPDLVSVLVGIVLDLPAKPVGPYRPGPHFVAIGASIGAVGIPVAKACGRTTLFEPDPRAFGSLLRNVDLNELPNVAMYNLALSDEPGRVVLDEAGRRERDARDVRVASRSRGVVRAMTLDSLPLGKIDVVLVDVGGMEGRVIDGASRTLARDLPALVVVARGSANAGAVVERALALGYARVRRFGDDRLLFTIP